MLSKCAPASDSSVRDYNAQCPEVLSLEEQASHEAEIVGKVEDDTRRQ